MRDLPEGVLEDSGSRESIVGSRRESFKGEKIGDQEQLWCWSGNERGTAKLYLLELDRTVILSNESVEKVPTTKKVSKLGVPKWYLDPRSSLIRQIRTSFYYKFFDLPFSTDSTTRLRLAPAELTVKRRWPFRRRLKPAVMCAA